MKRAQRALVAAGVTAAVAVAGVTGVGIANAATTNGNSTNTDPMSSLVQKIAQKFNLKQADVQAVFDSNRADMDKQREADVVSEQAQLVKDGKLTQAQSDAITTKRAELQKERDANRTSDQSKTDTQHRADMEARKTALDNWMKEKGIDTSYAYLLMGGRGGHGGPGGPGEMKGDRGMNTSSKPTSTTTSTTSN